MRGITHAVLTIRKIELMKNIFITLALMFVFTVANAQKFGYVDTDYILMHVPEYAEAQSELNKFSADWQAEIETKYETVQRLQEAYDAEKVLLTEEMKKKREAEIQKRRQEAMEMQKQKFGVGGELFNKREELIKPIQDQIYDAIKDVANSKGLMVIFDKAKQSNILYSNPKHDVSDNVIKKMGLKPGETIEAEEAAGKDQGKQNTNTNKDQGRSGGAKTDRGGNAPKK